ncbi:MAG: hypothetical protein R3D46_12745 [Defluviimonas denitrificans]
MIRAAATGESYEMPFSGEMCFQHVDEVTEIFLRCLAATPDGPVVSDLTTDVRSTADLLAAIRRLAPMPGSPPRAAVHRAGQGPRQRAPAGSDRGLGPPFRWRRAWRTLAAFRDGGGES